MTRVRRWTVTLALVAGVLVAGPAPTSDAPREGPAVALERVEVSPPSTPAVVADARAIRWMICRDPELPRHQRCAAGKGER